MYISQNIKFLRRKTGLNQKDLGKRINKTHGAIGEYERGNSLPPIDIILKFTEIFDVSIDDFVNRNLAAGEGEVSTPNKSESTYDAQDYKLMVKLLTDKILEVSEAIKEENPKLYEELGLDGIAEVVKG